MWWIAARGVGEDNPRGIAKEMRRQRFDLPRGTLAMEGGNGLVQPILLAEAVGSTFCVRGVAHPRPGRYLAGR
jgi:urea transport system substrate-binding protein